MINAITSLSSIQDVYRNYMVASFQPDASSTSQTDSLQLTKQGELFSAIMGMDEEERSEVKDFFGQVRESVNNGDFNAEQSAAGAPEALVSFAEENGIDLEELLTDMADRVGSGKTMPPPPPMMQEMSSGLSGTDRTELADFMQKMHASVMNGSFDAVSAAESAPKALVDYADTSGTSLEDLLQNMADDMEERKNMVPPPPVNGYSSTGAGTVDSMQSIAQVMLEALGSFQNNDSRSVWS